MKIQIFEKYAKYAIKIVKFGEILIKDLNMCVNIRSWSYFITLEANFCVILGKTQ